MTPEYADVLERIDGLVADVDILLRSGLHAALWRPVRVHLDGLVGDVERIAVALKLAA